MSYCKGPQLFSIPVRLHVHVLFPNPLHSSDLCVPPHRTRLPRDIPEERWIAKKLVALTVPKPAPKRAKHLQRSLLQLARASLSLMGCMPSSSRLCRTVRGSFTLSLFSSRGNQKTDGWLQCIENSACVRHVPHTISIYACQRVSKSVLQPTVSNQFVQVCTSLQPTVTAINCAQHGLIIVWSAVVSIVWRPSFGDSPPPPAPAGWELSSLGGGGIGKEARGYKRRWFVALCKL